MKKIAQLLLFFPFAILAQQPIINSISPTSSTVGETVTITGSNLGGRVFFGGVEAASVSGSGNVIEAVVPAGIGRSTISVLNNNLVAESSQQFFLSHVGTDVSTYGAEYNEDSGTENVNDLCLCDLDGDGRPEAITAHTVTSDSENESVIFRNTQTTDGGAAQFTVAAQINNPDNNGGFRSVSCADMDNDGRPELVYTTSFASGIKHIYIYHNQSPGAGTVNMVYLNALNIRLPDVGALNSVPTQIKLADLDGDGKRDMITGNEQNNVLVIYRNTSTPGSFSFEDEVELSSGNDFAGNIEIAEMNNDGRLDLILTPFRAERSQSSSNIVVMKNNSIVGDFSFEEAFSISNGSSEISDIVAGDLDGDGFNDIAVANRNGGENVNVYRNSSTTSTISLDAALDAGVSGTPFGVDLGDINGDGKLDIITPFVVENVVVVIPNNTSTPGTLIFGTATQLASTSTTQNVFISDLNGDAKADIAFTRNVGVGENGRLGVFVNQNCIVPEINPDGLTLCLNDQFSISTTKAAGVNSYTWSVVAPATGTIDVNNGDNALITITSAGSTADIQVVIDQNGTTGCTASAVTHTIVNGSQPLKPTITGPGAVVCGGDSFTLNVGAIGAGDSYDWMLPDGTITTTATNSLSIASATSSDAGDYTVRISPASGCATEVSDPVAVDVEVAPLRAILNQDCAGNGTEITLDIGTAGSFNYDWKRDGASIGETGTSITTSTPGIYTVDVETTANNCITESESFTVPTFPVAAFSLDSEICQDVPLVLSSSSTGDASFTLTTDWAVLDNSDGAIAATDTTQVGGDPLNFSFDNLGTYKVRLITEYSDFDICPDTLIQTIVVTAPPTIAFSVAEDTEKCQDESLTVGITAPDASSITNYEWSINGVITSGASETTAEAVTLTGVDSVYAVLTVTTDIGCTVMDSVKIKNFPTDADISSPNPIYDFSNDQDTLEEASFVELMAENLASVTGWSPGSIIDDSTATKVTVFPSTSSTVITLSGVDLNGCAVSTTVTIYLDNVRPKKTFSPNGDGLNDFWEILNTDVLTGCEVFIFDSRGRNILVANSPFPGNQVWDGNFSGSPVPEGIYYFVLKCSDSNLSKSGSILLAR